MRARSLMCISLALWTASREQEVTLSERRLDKRLSEKRRADSL
jgi:hypothetical protein